MQPPSSEPISLTVRVPYTGDRHLVLPPTTVVSDLIQQVLSQSPSPPTSPQCIIHSGHVLPDSSTLAEAGLSQGAVLHLMRRPSETSSSRRRRNNNPDHEHVHTNVLIGHIAVDGLVRFDDVHDVLTSVLTAVGFSNAAVTTAASVGAALAVAAQSETERGGASQRVLTNTWAAVRRLQNVLAQPDVAPSSLGTAVDDVVHSEDLSPQPQSDTRTESPLTNSAQASTPPPCTDNASNSVSTPSVELTVESPGQPSTSPSASNPLLPETPPQRTNDQSDIQASAAAADRLVPALATMLEQAATRIRSAPTLANISGTENVPEVERLAVQLANVASASTNLATLVASLLPPRPEVQNSPDNADIERSRSASLSIRPSENSSQQTDNASRSAADRGASSESRPQNAGNNGASRGGDASQNTAGANAPGSRNHRQTGGHPRFNMPGGVAGSIVFNGTEEAEIEISGLVEGSSLQGAMGFLRGIANNFIRSGSNNDNGSNSENQTQDSQTNIRMSQSNGNVVVEQHSPRSPGQTANADFLVHVLAYYLNSMAEDGPEEFDAVVTGDATALSVLNGFYGSEAVLEPAEPFLKLIYMIMGKLKPTDFHRIWRGDLRPVAAYRKDIWNTIKQHTMQYHPSSDRGDVESLFVEDVCDAFHEFVHKVEHLRRHEHGIDYLNFDNGDFCDAFMHLIAGKLNQLIVILNTLGGDAEVADMMKEWLSVFVGDFLHMFEVALEVGWDELLPMLRKALYLVGAMVVGTRIAVIFPFMANLFAGRAKFAIENVNTQPGDVALESVVDGSLSERFGRTPSCRSASSMCEDPMNDVPVDGLSACCACHGGIEPCEYSFNDDVDDPYLEHEAAYEADVAGGRCEGLEDEEPYNVDQNLFPDAGGHDGTQDEQAPSLDEEELKELTTELLEDSYNDSTVDQDDLDKLVEELVSKETSSSTNPQPAPSTARQTSSRSTSRANLGRRPGLAYASATAMSRSNISGTARSMFSGSAVSRGAFSSVAVSRGRGSASATTTTTTPSHTSSQSRDEFDVLGARDAPLWRRTIESDERRLAGRRYGPLSRGFQGLSASVPALNEGTAANIAVEAAREAAKSTGLSEEHTRELERVASQNGGRYLQEMERALRSRIASDPDFNREQFPNIARRFV